MVLWFIHRSKQASMRFRTQSRKQEKSWSTHTEVKLVIVICKDDWNTGLIDGVPEKMFSKGGQKKKKKEDTGSTVQPFQVKTKLRWISPILAKILRDNKQSSEHCETSQFLDRQLYWIGSLVTAFIQYCMITTIWYTGKKINCIFYMFFLTWGKVIVINTRLLLYPYIDSSIFLLQIKDFL